MDPHKKIQSDAISGIQVTPRLPGVIHTSTPIKMNQNSTAPYTPETPDRSEGSSIIEEAIALLASAQETIDLLSSYEEEVNVVDLTPPPEEEIVASSPVANQETVPTPPEDPLPGPSTSKSGGEWISRSQAPRVSEPKKKAKRTKAIADKEKELDEETIVSEENPLPSPTC